MSSARVSKPGPRVSPWTFSRGSTARMRTPEGIRRFRDGIEHVMNAVGDVDKGPTARSEHRSQARRFTAPSVTGAVVEPAVGFRLNDAPATNCAVRVPTPHFAAKQIARDVYGVSLEKRCWQRFGHWTFRAPGGAHRRRCTLRPGLGGSIRVVVRTCETRGAASAEIRPAQSIGQTYRDAA